MSGIGDLLATATALVGLLGGSLLVLVTVALLHRRRSTRPRARAAAREPRSSSPGRCSFCHDDLDDSPRTTCANCLATHHEDCWTEHGACSSCGGPARLPRVVE